MLRIFKKTKVYGSIGFHGLTDWWLSDFSKKERDYICKTFNPLGGNSGKNYLIKRKISSTSETPIALLSSLTSWFEDTKDKEIAYKLLKKGEELIDDTSDILDVHFFFDSKIRIYYGNRNTDDTSLKETIKACEQQIKIAPKAVKAFRKEYGKKDKLPSHTGFDRLIFLKEKEKKYDEAIKLSKIAMKQGWNGY